MSAETLNRIGIILNFLAGFLLAPELLGIERIRKFETFIETRITILKGFTERITQGSLGRALNPKPFMSFRLIGSTRKEILKNLTKLSFWLIAIIAIIYGYKQIGINIIVFYFLFEIISLIYKSTKNLLQNAKEFRAGILSDIYHKWANKNLIGLIFSTGLMLVINIISVPITYPFLLLLLIASFILIVILDLLATINKITSLTLRKLEGDDVIRSALVGLGILFFIFGNVLQFIATF